MLKILGIAAGLVVAAIAGLLIHAATKPDTFRVERSIAIKAPPERITSTIADLRGWAAWSPWERKDPDMRRSFSGPPVGKGAVYEWQGDNNVGHGRMEILEAGPARVLIKLDFVKPFEAHNTAEFATVARGDSTTVTWAMYGAHPFFGKVIHSVIDMDKMIGRDFEAGLAGLKAVVEK